MGFVLEPEEAAALIAKDQKNRDCLFPYLNGEDLNSRPDQTPSRWVINFFDWPLKRVAGIGQWVIADSKIQKEWLQQGIVPEDYPDYVAADYPDLLAIVEDRVRPEREKNRYSTAAREKWWLYERLRHELYSKTANFSKALVRAQVSRTHAPSFVETVQVFSMMCIVFPIDTYRAFTNLQTNFHEVWLNEYSSSLKKDQRYTPSDCFDTYPFPEDYAALESIGERYYTHRQTIMQARNEGLTKTYNRFHNPEETSPDIAQLRALHKEMDEAVAAAYGWQDLSLGHGFHETKQGLRYTISESARREVLDRLLALNHERFAQEQALEAEKTKAQAVVKQAAKGKKKITAPGPNFELF